VTEPLGYTGPAEALVGYYADRKPRAQMYQFRVTCRLCGGPLRRVLDLGSCPLANEYWTAEQVASGQRQDTFPIVVAQCSSCEHVQTQTIVNPERLYSEYSYTSGIAASFREHLRSLATELRAAGHRTIVDIGSNDGTLLHYCRNLGMTGLGVDPARNLAAEASSRGDLTIPAFFNVETAREIRRMLGKAPDVVTCLNAFAHTDDLAAIADGVRELIGETGEFVFEVAYLLDLLEKNEVGSTYHEHISHHSVVPLYKFFAAHGLSLHDVKRIPTQGGSIRGYVRMHQWPNEMYRWIELEDKTIPALLADWPARIERERVATLAELQPYLAPRCEACGGNPGVKFGPCPTCQGGGKKQLGALAIFGAPARLTPYVHMLGLKREDVSCVFDDEPRKVGRFTPGLHWLIVSPDELMARNPPAILISAWPYAEQIKARFPEYRGAWILPKREGA